MEIPARPTDYGPRTAGEQGERDQPARERQCPLIHRAVNECREPVVPHSTLAQGPAEERVPHEAALEGIGPGRPLAVLLDAAPETVPVGRVVKVAGEVQPVHQQPGVPVLVCCRRAGRVVLAWACQRHKLGPCGVGAPGSRGRCSETGRLEKLAFDRVNVMPLDAGLQPAGGQDQEVPSLQEPNCAQQRVPPADDL